MNQNDFNIQLLCGEKGVGKTFYAKTLVSYLYFDSNSPLSKIKTFGIIEESLYKNDRPKTSITDEKLCSDLEKALKSVTTIIIDEVESVNEEALKLIINVAYLKKISHLVFIFDMSSVNLMQCPTFRLLVEWEKIPFDLEISNFCVDDCILKQFIAKKYEKIDSLIYDFILNTTNRNFNNINTLMWTKKLLGDVSSSISKEVILKYVDILLENKFKDLPPNILKTLKQSSIIGEVFKKDVLEDPNGFNIFGVSKYLQDIEAMHIFIKSYLDHEDAYTFLSNDMYSSIYDSIAPEEKKEWTNILIKYYTAKLNHEADESSIIEHLNHIKQLQSFLKNEKEVFKINHKLLYDYQKIGDVKKNLKIIDELVETANKENYVGLEQYLLLLKMKTLINLANFEGALKTISVLYKDSCFGGSLYYLQYYRASCMYNIGQVYQAYVEVKKIIKNLKKTSVHSKNNPVLYSQAYSLMATIQNHLNMDDAGYHYYKLALNHSYNRIENKSLYYSILKKCDMFYSYDSSKTKLLECINFYEKNNSPYETAKIYLNLATEIMFQESGKSKMIKQYFEKVKDCFSPFPNEHLAYVKNNLSIYYALEENNASKALDELKEAFFVGLTDFTYMTMSLNICTYLILLNRLNTDEFTEAYDKFTFYVEKLSDREYASQYEKIYKEILDLIIYEQSDNCDFIIEKCNSLLDDKNTATFFYPIITDIKKRNNFESVASYSHNSNYYNKINDKKIFLDVFRFWE